jgi:hypothetical protein
MAGIWVGVATPFVRYVVREWIGGNGEGDRFPQFWVDRQTRQRDLLGGPLGAWAFDSTAGGPYTSRGEADGAADLLGREALASATRGR